MPTLLLAFLALALVCLAVTISGCFAVVHSFGPQRFAASTTIYALPSLVLGLLICLRGMMSREPDFVWIAGGALNLGFGLVAVIRSAVRR